MAVSDSTFSNTLSSWSLRRPATETWLPQGKGTPVSPWRGPQRGGPGTEEAGNPPAQQDGDREQTLRCPKMHHSRPGRRAGGRQDAAVGSRLQGQADGCPLALPVQAGHRATLRGLSPASNEDSLAPPTAGRLASHSGRGTFQTVAHPPPVRRGESLRAAPRPELARLTCLTCPPPAPRRLQPAEILSKQLTSLLPKAEGIKAPAGTWALRRRVRNP